MIFQARDNPTGDKLRAEGYTLSGGMWGSACWKRLSPTVVIGIGQALAVDGEPCDDLDNADAFFNAPENETDPCMIWVYSGNIEASWDIADGECPFGAGGEIIPAIEHRAADLRKALLKVQAIASAESVLAKTFAEIDALA